MKRREFIGLAAGAAAFAGCKCPCSCGGMERLGVCSWSFQKPMDEVAERMKSMGLKRIHLALQPVLEGDARHGAAEDASARARASASWIEPSSAPLKPQSWLVCCPEFIV